MTTSYISEAGALKDHISIPHSIKVLGENGQVTTKKLNLPSKVYPFCGICGSPKGGWYGPFGALRMTGYTFFFLKWCLSPLVILQIWPFTDLLGVALSGLLLIGCQLSQWAAFSHEGLANEVGVMAEQNDRFAANNENLEHQLDDLKGVINQLERRKASLGGLIDEFSTFVDRFHKVNNTNLITNILNAYLQADSLYGDRNKELEGKEASYFFNTASPVLEEAFPDKAKEGYFRTMAHAAKHHGFDLWGMSMLACAVVHNENIKMSNAHLALVMFSLDGDLPKCLEFVAPALEGRHEAVELDQYIKNWRSEADGELVPRKELIRLSKEINKAAANEVDTGDITH